MSEKRQQIIDAIKAVAEILNKNNISWLVGGSGSLLVHGLDITPNDADIVIDISDYQRALELLKNFVTGPTTPIGRTQRTPFKVGEITGDLVTYDIKADPKIAKDYDGINIYVYPLEREYEYYKNRQDKKEANKIKLELIEKALHV